MAETITLTDDEMVIEVLNFFYPDNPINEHLLNTESRDLAAVMYAEGLKASDAMHLVPRPSLNPSFSWLQKEAVKAAWRSIQEDNNIYDAVKNTVALKFKSKYAMAKSGI